MKIAVAAQESTSDAADLAAELAIPLIELRPESAADAAEYDYLLHLEQGRLELRSTLAEFPGALCVDFADAKLHYRAQSAMAGQNIAKAIGLKGRRGVTVLDATAGLGKDAFLLASLGCEVQMLERSAVVHALLANGLARAESYDAETSAILSRMRLTRGDFLEYEPDSMQFDVVYLDPMFPQRRKSAKVKKDMALLQHLLGSQSDGAQLLEQAKRLAKKRVVVKRAKLSPALGETAPDIEYKGSSSRYDVYLVV